MYINWLGKKMWTFDPAKRLVQGHLTTFKDRPSASHAAKANAEYLKEHVEEDHKMSQ
jgi:hypothetical protein